MHLTKASKCFKMTESVYYFIFLGNQLAKGVLVSNQRRVSRSFSDNSNTRRSRGGEVRGPDTDPDLSPVPLDPPVYLSSIYIQSNTIMSQFSVSFIIPCMGLTQKRRFKRVPCDFKERRANQNLLSCKATSSACPWSCERFIYIKSRLLSLKEHNH